MSVHAGHRRSIRVRDYDYAAPGAYHITICTQGKACVLGDIARDEVRLSEAGQMVESWWCTIPNKFPHVALDAYVVMPNHLHGILRMSIDEHLSSDASPGSGRPPCRPSPAIATDIETANTVSPDEGGHGGPPLPDGHGTPFERIDHHADSGRGRPPCLPWLPAATVVTTANAVSPDEGGHGGPPLPGERGGSAERPALGDVIRWFKSATTRDYGVGVERFGWPPYPGRFWQRNYFERIVRDEAELDRIRGYIAANPARWRDDDEYRADSRGWEHRP